MLADAVEVRTTIADIEVSSLALNAALNPGDSSVRTLTISNAGTADLNWNLAENPGRGWLDESPISGTVLAGGPAGEVTVSFDATGLSSGNYTTTLQVTSNDPNEPQVDVAVTLVVTTTCIPVSGVSFEHSSPVYVDETACFTATVTSGSLPYTYEWDFGGSGNGTGLATATPTFTFTAAGDFTTSLTVTNACGLDSAFESITVALSPEPPPWYIYLPIVMRHW